MVDYTSSRTGSSGIWIFVAAAVVVLLLLYALFAGSNVGTEMDPVVIGTPDSAPIVEDVVPAAPAEPAAPAQ